MSNSLLFIQTRNGQKAGKRRIKKLLKHKEVTEAIKKLFKTTDILGRETKGNKNTSLFYIYDDGTVEKKIVIE